MEDERQLSLGPVNKFSRDKLSRDGERSRFALFQVENLICNLAGPSKLLNTEIGLTKEVILADVIIKDSNLDPVVVMKDGKKCSEVPDWVMIVVYRARFYLLISQLSKYKTNVKKSAKFLSVAFIP